jgi:hypothetical protein
MADFNIRSDSVNVEQIMQQIRARIREKRGVDYTEQQIRELAAVKLERFLDPQKVRSGLLEQFREGGISPIENYSFEDTTLFESHRAPLRWMRKLLKPILKLFFNPNPLIHVLHMQAGINNRHTQYTEISYELLHNLVLETTRLGIEVKNLKMRVESLSGRFDFSERRARALEGIVQARADRAERGDRPERSDRPERPERGDRPDRFSGPRRAPQVPEAAAAPQRPAADVAAGQGTQAPPAPGEPSADARKKRRRRRGRRTGAGRPGAEGAQAGLPIDAGEDGGGEDQGGGEQAAPAGEASGPAVPDREGQ